MIWFFSRRKMISLLLLFCLLSSACCLLMGCSGNRYMGKDMAEESSAAPDTGSIVAENKVYGLSLPNAKKVGELLQDFIYWEYATEIGKEKGSSIINYLKEAGFPETETTIRLYYRECDKEEYDYRESNFYNIVAFSPDNQALSDLTFEYNTKGLSSEYDCNYGTPVDENGDELGTENISPQELEKNISSWYTFFGETSITLNEAAAKSYDVKNKFPAGEKEKILSAIRKTIKKQYKNADNVAVYIHDFFPGDLSLSGRVINLHITDKYDIPLFWIQSSICYTGAKMEKFKGIGWNTHHSTAYSGASQPNYNPTLKQVKEWAREENNGVNISKCVLAYQIKKGKLIDLKH